MVLTHHAEKRIKQRAIPKRVLELLWSYGSRIPLGKGAQSVCFSSRNERKFFETDLKRQGINPKKHWSSTYLIACNQDNTIVTAAYGHKRKRRSS